MSHARQQHEGKRDKRRSKKGITRGGLRGWGRPGGRPEPSLWGVATSSTHGRKSEMGGSGLGVGVGIELEWKMGCGEGQAGTSEYSAGKIRPRQDGRSGSTGDMGG